MSSKYINMDTVEGQRTIWKDEYGFWRCISSHQRGASVDELRANVEAEFNGPDRSREIEAQERSVGAHGFARDW